MAQETIDNPNLIGTLKVGQKDVLLYRTEEEGEDVIKVRFDPTEDKDIIFDYVESRITIPRWWTWEYWEKKGLPKEQMQLTDGEHNLTFYNYGESLKPDQLVIINRVLGMFAGIRNGEIFKHMDHILIDDIQPMNEKSGELANGHGFFQAKALALYPNAFADIPNRVTDKVSNLEGTLTHELAHGFSDVMLGGESSEYRTINQWMIVGNWDIQEEMRVLPGGQTTHVVTTEPDRCVTEYAKADEEEDMAESMVAAIFDPEKLDPQKLQFLQENFPFDQSKQTTWNVSPEENIKLPETPSEFKVKFLGKKKTY